MNQRKFFKAIDAVVAKKFETEAEMLIALLDNLVSDDQINVKGGRIWALETHNKSYRLLYQTGNVERINKEFVLYISDYPIFDKIADERTVLADETNLYLRSKGIFKYSASGIGSKVKIDDKSYYEYLLALNSDSIDDELRYILNIAATVLTSQLKQRRLSDSQRVLMAGIDRAKQLQKSILPEHEYKFANYQLFGLTVPADTIGGDFFDYLRLGDGEDRLGIAVGDVASKGIDAAAEAFYISGALRMACTFQIKISPLMKKLNELVNKIFSDDRFISLFYGEISTDKKGLCLYANAGHNPPIFVKGAEKKIVYLEPTGPLLGPSPKANYETDNINFSKDDLLVIYSDGITDAMNKEGELYEQFDRLEKVILKNCDLTPKEIAYRILDDVLKFSSNGAYADDKTIVVVKKIA